MSTTYELHTLLDLTKTNVLRSHSPKIPGLTDISGQVIYTNEEWTRSRNQQRNWETIIQLLSLRAQPDPQDPIRLDNQLTSFFNFDPIYGKYATVWNVKFTTEIPNLFEVGNDPVALLREDFDRIPMIVGLNETVTIQPPLMITNLPGRNTVFTFVYI